MNVKKCVRALLCLYLTLIIATDAVKGQSLKVGDTLPPELWSIPLDVINHPEGKEILTLGEYRDKLIILDFWATWCSPCIAMLPKQDSLQRQFKDQLQILPVTYQTGEEVSTFMEKYEKRKGVKNILPKVVNNQSLKPYFEHGSIPHYIWIKDGEVKAITGRDEVTEANVHHLMSDEDVKLIGKKGIAPLNYDVSKPIFLQGNGGDGQNMIYHSILTGYTPGLNGGLSIEIGGENTQRITLKNASRLWLFRVAYFDGHSFFSDRDVKLMVQHPEKLTSPLAGEAYLNWLSSNNGFCYEIFGPPSLASNIKKIMIQDLNNFFPEYTAIVESRADSCLILERLAAVDSFTAASGQSQVQITPMGWQMHNAHMESLVTYLNGMGRFPFPVYNESGIQHGIDMEIVSESWDYQDVNTALADYGLKLSFQIRERNQLIITDTIR